MFRWLYTKIFSPTSIITKIHDCWYDLTDFKHPGGPVALTLAANRDATGLFESHHVLKNRKDLQAILNRYQIKNKSTIDHLEKNIAKEDSTDSKFIWGESGFREEIRQIARDHFTNQTMKAPLAKWIEMGLLALLAGSSLWYSYNGSWLGLLVSPLFMWLAMVNHFHDASHFALSNRWWINWLGMYPSFWFTSPTTWLYQHVVSHHNYVNIAERDVDLYHGVEFVRGTKYIPWLTTHKYQHQIGFVIQWLFSHLGIAILLPLETLSGQYHGHLTIPKTRLIHTLLHILARGVVFSLFYVLPWWQGYPWWKSLIWSLYPSFILGLLFMWFTQINHITEENMDKYDPDYYKHQVITAHNIAPQSNWVRVLTGGLNLQIEHHLFPSINHYHLMALQPKVEAACNKWGVPYHQSPDLVTAGIKYWTHLRKLSINENMSAT